MEPQQPGPGGPRPDPGSTGALTVRAAGRRREGPEDEGAALLPAPSRHQDDNLHGELATCLPRPIRVSRPHRGGQGLSPPVSGDFGGTGRRELARGQPMLAGAGQATHTARGEARRVPAALTVVPPDDGLATSPSLSQRERKSRLPKSTQPAVTAKVQTFGAVCCTSHLCRLPPRAHRRTPEGRGRAEGSGPRRLRGGRRALRFGEPPHAGGRLAPLLTGSGNAGGRGQPQPKGGA